MAAWPSIGEFSIAKHPWMCLIKSWHSSLVTYILLPSTGSAAIQMGFGAKEMAS